MQLIARTVAMLHHHARRASVPREVHISDSLLCSKAWWLCLVQSHLISQLLCLVFDVLCAYFNDGQAFASLLALTHTGPERIIVHEGHMH